MLEQTVRTFLDLAQSGRIHIRVSPGEKEETLKNSEAMQAALQMMAVLVDHPFSPAPPSRP